MLLITLGTTVNDQPDFFRTCAATLVGLPWHVVLTLGNREVRGRVRVLRDEVRVAGRAGRAAAAIEARLLVRGRS